MDWRLTPYVAIVVLLVALFNVYEYRRRSRLSARERSEEDANIQQAMNERLGF
jgi:regulatory protein YycI of two-component signal transduction system YycFG